MNQPYNRFSVFPGALVLLCALVLFSCGPKGNNTGQQVPAAASTEGSDSNAVEITLTEEQWNNAGLQVSEVAPAFINETIRLNGQIDVPPQNMISISCPLGGYVKNIHLLPGEPVAKGQAIAVLEDPGYIQLQQDYLAGKARLQLLTLEYNRQKELAATEAASQKALQQAAAELQTTQISQKALQQKLALIGIDAGRLTAENLSRAITLRSPTRGFVSHVFTNIGKYVTPTDVLVDLVDPSDIHANLVVYEKDIARVQKGQKVEVRLVNQPDKAYLAEVLLVTKNVDETRAGQVHCHFEQYHPQLLPGMFIQADVELGTQQLPAVPAAAVVQHKGQQYVFVQTGPRP
ncbi:MAG TPA: efflux RND transporter periplasmic adaptor subunit, partial [Phnomibacter sp.]|nr:efflux RND transporter periplasmic adaptor subunit [Phnomibacter sp.]